MQKYNTLATNQRETHQQEKVRADQVENNAGGYVFKLDDFDRLDRFLILGSDSNTYYQNARELTEQNVDVIKKLIVKDGIRVVNRVVEISQSGRAPKNDPGVFVLAMASGSDDKEVRKHALNHLGDVCRIPTHLFMFLEYAKLFRGRGRLFQEALRRWYMDKSPDQLVYHMLKYRQREGWTHRDVLRLAKPKGAEGDHQTMFAWVTGKDATKNGPYPEMLEGFILANKAKSEKDCAEMIKDFNLAREMIPTQFLKSPVVWEALLEKMPMTAMIRNLGNMGSCGLLKPMSEASKTVISKITKEAVEKSRIHPIQILYAAKTYAQGRGMRGSNSWPVDGNISDILDDAFYMAFKNVESTDKKFLVGIDVSGSMGWSGDGIMQAREIAAAMSVVHVRSEQQVHYMAFSSGFIPLNITRKSTINSVMRQTNSLNFDRTDCALPMLYALRHKLPIDCFAVYTDNETWYGEIHPFQALKKYRDEMGINAKLVVCGVTSTGFTIANPQDPGMLDVVGFDSAVPSLINDFVKH